MENKNTGFECADGCCGCSSDAIDMHSVVDLHYQTSLLSCVVGRGTITIHSDNDMYPELSVSMFGARHVFEEMKEVCSQQLGCAHQNTVNPGYNEPPIQRNPGYNEPSRWAPP